MVGRARRKPGTIVPLLSHSMKMGAEIRVLTWRMSIVPPVGMMKVQKSLTPTKTTPHSQREDQNQVAGSLVPNQTFQWHQHSHGKIVPSVKPYPHDRWLACKFVGCHGL